MKKSAQRLLATSGSVDRSPRWLSSDELLYHLELGFDLFDSHADRGLLQTIRADVASYLGFEPHPQLESLLLDEDYSPEATQALPHCDTCKSSRIAIFDSDYVWACEKCQQTVVSVFGCLNCTRVVCRSCVKRYRGTDDAGLQEIASELGVTRQAVRATLHKALRKLRHPSRAKLLRGFVDRSQSVVARQIDLNPHRGPSHREHKPKPALPVSLRVTDGALELIDTNPLLDGTECFIQETGAWYRLNSRSIELPDPPKNYPAADRPWSLVSMDDGMEKSTSKVT